MPTLIFSTLKTTYQNNDEENNKHRMGLITAEISNNILV